eukprot:m.226476 g.226476  ORF g.226476 m.226476 type:complete len:424 (-) comp22359_c0_seq3:2829-4100(-)
MSFRPPFRACSSSNSSVSFCSRCGRYSWHQRKCQKISSSCLVGPHTLPFSSVSFFFISVRFFLCNDPGQAQYIRPHIGLLVVFDGQLWSLSPQQEALSPAEVLLLKSHARLPNKNIRDTLFVMGLGNALGAVPVLNMHIHEHSFLGPARLDELLFCSVELPLVLQMHGVPEIHIWQLAFGGRAGQLECKVKGPRFTGNVHRLLNHVELGQQLDAALTTQRHGPQIPNLLRCNGTPVLLGHPVRVLPHVLLPVHVDSRLPVICGDVVGLGLGEHALALQCLGQVGVCLVKQVGVMLFHQPHHVIILLQLLVHVDGVVGLVHGDIQLFRFFVFSLLFQGFGLLQVEVSDVFFPHVTGGQAVRLLPFASLDVHVDGTLRVFGSNIVLGRLLKLSSLCIMVGNHFEVGACNSFVLQLHDLCSLSPLP